MVKLVLTISFKGNFFNNLYYVLLAKRMVCMHNLLQKSIAKSRFAVDCMDRNLCVSTEFTFSY